MKLNDLLKRGKKEERQRGIGYLHSGQYRSFIGNGFTTLADVPEVVAGVREIANLISSMTIHIMANGDSGDYRIVNELSRKIDIAPSKYMTRKTWLDAVVMNLLLYGNGNSIVLPHTKKGLLDDLEPINPRSITYESNGYDYNVIIDGQRFDPSEVLHFTYNQDPEYVWLGKGLSISLTEVAKNLEQARATEKAFLSNEWSPNLIVKVDALVDEFSSPIGRERLLDEYFKTRKKGQPWMIPSEQFDIEQVKPLTLNDLAISSQIELNKKTVASILGIPAFVLGVGNYSSVEWDNFINKTIRPIAQIIEQELTKKLILSPKWYVKFSISSLYSYDLNTVANVYSNLYTKGLVTGNEARDKLGMSPLDGLDELVILENYIPQDKIGDQQKLGGTDGTDNNN